MLMTPVGDHGVQRAATGRSEGGEEPQSLGQHVTDMGKPNGEKQSIAPPLQAPGHPARGDAAFYCLSLLSSKASHFSHHWVTFSFFTHVPRRNLFLIS